MAWTLLASAQKLVPYFLDAESAEAALANFDELLERNVERHGKWQAHRRYWFDVVDLLLRSCWNVGKIAVKRTRYKWMVKAIAGLGVIVPLVYSVYPLDASLRVAGALLLKAHAENPAQVSIGHGLGSLGAKVAFVTLPDFSKWINSTLGISSTVSQTLGVIQ
jgi:hypothetical protein